MVLRLVFIAFLLLLGSCGDLDFNNPTDPRNISRPKDIEYESFTDSRDEKSYRSVVIGSQTWMAENINFETSGSFCIHCSIYGRLYGFEEATFVCPDGWHLPSIEEWNRLLNYASWTELKTDKGWALGEEGTDIYGFSALPGGGGTQDYEDQTGSYGSWWSSTVGGDGDAYLAITYSNSGFIVGTNNLSSVRCVKNKYCGQQVYNPETQVCDNDIIYGLCGNEKYNPATQRCGINNIVETACGNEWFDATNENFRCNNETLETKCGTEWYNPVTYFCLGNTPYELCGGNTYDPVTQRCSAGNALEVKCGTEWYNPLTHFCLDDTPYRLCGGSTYDPVTQRCSAGNALEVKCGTEWYNPATYFCLGNTHYELCGGNMYDPATQRCTGGVLESKCGATWYNPLTHICSGNTVSIKSSSSSAPSSSSSSSLKSSSSSYNPNEHVNCDGYCIWDLETMRCDRIATDPLGEWGYPVYDCREAILNCLQFSPSHQVYSDSYCTNPYPY